MKRILLKRRIAHKAAAEIFRKMADEKPAGVVLADILHCQALCQLEQAVTLARIPEKRADAENNLLAARWRWEMLRKQYPKVPTYQSGSACASLLLGKLRAEDKNFKEAERDLEAACDLLRPLAEKFTDTAMFHANLGRAYAELGRLARIKNDTDGAAAFFKKAEESLNRAVDLSNNDVQYRKSRDEVQAERKH